MTGNASSQIAVTVVVRSHTDDALVGKGGGRTDVLRRALFSIWSQDTSQTIELLLLTSGYPQLEEQECVAYLGQAKAECRPAGVRIFRHINFSLKGDTRARLLNAGLCEARGKYLFFLDDDDVLRQCALTRLLVKADTAEADIVFGRVDIVFHTSTSEPEEWVVVPYAARPPTLLNLVRHNSAPLSSFLIRRPPPGRLPLVDEALCSFEDYALLLQILQTAEVASVDFAYAVSEYWVQRDGGSQADRYRATIGEDMERIESLKRRLVFQVNGADLIDAGRATDERQAIRALLGDLTEDREDLIQVHVDQVIETRFGFTYVGWLVGRGAAAQEALHLFALQADGGADLVEVRFPRADVAAHLGLQDVDVGFSFSSCGRCEQFVAIGAGRKRVVCAPKL